MIYLRQSTASQEVPLGHFVDSTDGNTEETGLTINNTDIKIWKAGATTLANKNSGGATHISNGIYYAVLDATDTDTIGSLVIFVHVSGALAVRLECVVLDEAVYDVQFGTTAPATTGNLTSSTVGTVTTLTNLPAITSNWLTAAGIAASALNGKGDWNIGKTGYALSSAGIQAIWDALTSALTTVGSIGKLLVDNINATISSRLASASYTAPLDAAGTRSAVGLASANLDTQLSGIQSDTNDIQTRIPAALVGGRIDSNVGAISGDSTAADLLEAWLDGFVTGTAQAADVNNITLAAGESSVDDLYKNYRIRIQSGTGAGQTAIGTAYNGTTKALSILPTWSVTPDNTSVYLLVPFGAVNGNVVAINENESAQVWLDTLVSDYFGNGVLGANVQQWVGETVASTIIAGVPRVDMAYINGGATNGNNATLSLKQLNIINNTGTALIARSTGGNGDGIEATGQGTGKDINATTTDSLEVNATAGGGGLDAAGVRAAVGLASANLDTQLAVIDNFLDTEMAAVLEDTGTTLPAQIAALNNLSPAQVNAEVVDALTVDVIADSVAADGSRPTIGQALLMLTRFLMERSVNSTTMTVRKEDGSTANMTFTLNDASAPTSITRAS